MPWWELSIKGRQDVYWWLCNPCKEQVPPFLIRQVHHLPNDVIGGADSKIRCDGCGGALECPSAD